jgi:nucleotide-binding universal stress UspA family protein
LFTTYFYPGAENGRSTGGALVWKRLQLAIDQFESGQVALRFVADVASANDATVRVLHLRELSRMARVMPLQTPDEAEDLVREAVHSLQLLGVAAEGRSCSVLEDHVAQRIVKEAALWECDAIALGSRRLRGIGRLSGRGVRERTLRLSPLPVLVAPTPEIDGIIRPARFRDAREHTP